MTTPSVQAWFSKDLTGGRIATSEHGQIRRTIAELRTELREVVDLLQHERYYAAIIQVLRNAYLGVRCGRQRCLRMVEAILTFVETSTFVVDTNAYALGDLVHQRLQHRQGTITIRFSTTPIEDDSYACVPYTNFRDPRSTIVFSLDHPPYGRRSILPNTEPQILPGTRIDDIVACPTGVLLHELIHLYTGLDDVRLAQHDLPDGFEGPKWNPDHYDTMQCYGVYMCQALAASPTLSVKALENPDNITIFVILLYLSGHNPHLNFTKDYVERH